MDSARVEQEVERNYHFNFWCNLIDISTYWFGASFISAAVMIPLYVSHYTASPVILGLIPMINTAGFLIPQLFIANWVESLPHKKKAVMILGFFGERMTILLLPLVALPWVTRNSVLALVLFMACYAWYCVGAGLTTLPWQEMIAKIIPMQRRGFFFGLSQFLGMLTGTAGAAVAAWMLGYYAFPYGYTASFALAGILLMISYSAVALAREPVVVPPPRSDTQWQYLRSLPDVLHRDPNFTRFLIAQVVISLGGMAVGFLVVYPTQQWQLPDSQAGTYLLALQVGQAIASLLLGSLADRKGHKLVLEISILLGILGFGTAFLAPSPLWFNPVFFVRGASLGGLMISGMMIVFEFGPVEARPTYIGLANTLPGIASAVGPLLGGIVAEYTGYRWLFLIAFLVSLAGFSLLHWTVKEPRHTAVNSQPAQI